mmetsp:Transcript_19114/g.44399  ORF Transcript_19114/g.44399 Transcript_19114/m.44399 type:complete len:112 (+) Transcript_19114:1-336(+)
MNEDGRGEPVLVVVNNESMVDLLDEETSATTVSGTIKAFGKDFGMQWMEPIENLTVANDSETKRAVISMISGENEIRIVKDLVDHWERGAKSEWTSASSLESFSKRYKKSQ